MKPIHFAAVGAAIAVVVVLVLMLESDRGRASSRRGSDREAAVPVRDEMPDRDSGEPEPDGSLHVTLRVVRPDGTAARGATVRVEQHGAQADDSGRARIGGLRPGRYSLTARLDRAAGALGFELKDRSRDLGTLVLRDGVGVTGHVYDIRKKPIAGATVQAIPVEREASRSWISYTARLAQPDAIAAGATTGSDGAYELLLPGRGEYALRATAPKYAMEVEGARPWEEPTSGIDFYLLPGRELTGRVVDEVGQPIAAARVISSGFGGRRDAGAAVKYETLTAADGSFTVGAVTATWIHLAARAPGYAPYVDARLRYTGRPVTITLQRGMAVRLRTIDKQTRAPAAGIRASVSFLGGNAEGDTDEEGVAVVEPFPLPGTRPGSGFVILTGGGYVPKRVSLRDEEAVGGVLDLGEIEVERGGTVRGRVTDAKSGAGVAGASVRPFGGIRINLALMIEIEARTDEEGRYVLTGVPLDVATVIAAHEDYVMDVDRTELFRLMRGGTKRVFAEGQTEARFDLELLPATGVRGVVLDPDGTPIGGARVRRAFGSPGISRILGGGEPVAISANGTGAFLLGGLKQGETVNLLATHRDYGASAQVDATAGSDEVVTLELAPPLTLEGVVLDEQDRPVAGVHVSLAPKSGAGRPGVPNLPAPFGAPNSRPGLTDGEGRYVLRNAPSGELTITFRHDDYAVVRRDVAVGGSPSTDLGKTVLSRGPGIEGTVVDRAGNPRADVSVTLRWDGNLGPGEFGDNQGRTWANAVTDRQGRFAAYGLREGDFQLQVFSGGLTSDRPVVKTGTTDARVTVVTAVTMTGRVMSAGRPVEGAWVRAQRGRGARPGSETFIASGRTGKDGSFRLDRLPPGETFTIVVSHNDYKQTIVEGVSASHGGRTFTLQAGGRIGGVVVEPDGTPVPNASLRIFLENDPVKWARSDAEGRFELGGLEEGSLEIQMESSAGGHIKSGRIAIRSGDLAIRIVVERGLAIRGKVILAPAPVSRALRVEALDDRGDVVRSAWVFAGRQTFNISGLRKGVYTVRVKEMNADGGKLLSELHNVSAGTENLEIEVAR